MYYQECLTYNNGHSIYSTNTQNMLLKKLKVQFLKFGVLFTLLLLVSCSSDDESPENLIVSKNLVVNRVYDLDNESNAQDVYVSITINNIEGLSEVRAIIAETAGIATLTKAKIEGLSVNNYSTFNVTNRIVTGRLNSEQTDINGKALSLNTDYQVVIYNPIDFTISIASNAFMLTNAAPLAGEYVGTWNDNLFSDILVSARISSSTSDGPYSGDFFISTNLTAAWGAATDGDISFTLINNEIEAFRYDQNLPDYMGGCPGVYVGTGSIEDNITLVINFTGDDCDGHHEDGVISLKRTQ